jgi:hypothetical protein
MSAKRPRRAFLKELPATVAASLTVPTLATAQPQAGSVTADDLGVAQRLGALSLPATSASKPRSSSTATANTSKHCDRCRSRQKSNRRLRSK